MSEYRLLSPIGRGGMGEVYRAERVLAAGLVLPAACKAIHPAYGKHEDVAALFRREAAVALQLSVQHPNLVTVYDFYCDAEDRLMLAMELVDGVALSGLVRTGPLPLPVIRRILYEVLQALAYVHDCGVLHRDVSPENILLSKQGTVKLSDFGLSKVLAAPGSGSQPSFKGKAPYASPEAIQAQALEPRADLWSIAAVTHELLAGAAPFGRGDILHIFRVQTTVGPTPLPDEVAADLRALTADLGIVDPGARQFQYAAAMLRLIEESNQPMSTPAELGALVQRACNAVSGSNDGALAYSRLPQPRPPHSVGGPRPQPHSLLASPPVAEARHRQPGGTQSGRLRPVALRMILSMALLAGLLALGAFFAGMLAGRQHALPDAALTPSPPIGPFVAPAGEPAGERAPNPPAAVKPASQHADSATEAQANHAEQQRTSPRSTSAQGSTAAPRTPATTPKHGDGPEQRAKSRARGSSAKRRQKRHVVPNATVPQ